MVEFLVLGPLEVKSGDATVDIGGPKPRTLLAHLVANANGGVTTEALIDRMWGENPPASAANSLQTYVSRLRGVLGSDLIQSSPTGYTLVVDRDAVDLLRFETLVAEGRAMLDSDAAHASRVLAEAADLWRGRPFEGIADDGNSLAPETTRLDELRMTAVEDRITADLELGRHGVLTGEIEGLLDEHPYRERLWGLLMTALVRSGRQADALRAYQRARLILGDELGIEPSPELREIEDQILLQDEALRAAPTQEADLRNPYKGLAAFKEDDAADFFGRSHLVEQLLEHVHTSRFLAVVGPSGSGKSSVVRAGVIPALRAGRIVRSDRWLIASMIPGAHPFAELEGALLRAAPEPPASLMEQLRDEDLGLLRAALRILPDEESELVLLIDQFEELFTLVESEETRQRFLRSLRLAVETPNSRLRVITTLRADFYDRPLLYPEFGKLFTGGMVSVMPLSTVELEEAVHGPAERAGVAVEPSLVATLLADVAAQPGALPLFQYTLTELFAARTDSLLTLESYEKIGGLSGALAGRADSLFDRLDADGRHAARQLFLRLVTIGEHGEDSRRRIAAAELDDLPAAGDAMRAAVEAFGGHRLLTFDRNPLTGEATVEVAHEALLREWPRLQEWIQDARNDLRRHLSFRAAVDEWLAADRDPDYLLTGTRLSTYEGWAAKTTLELTNAERAFLDAGVKRREDELAASEEAAAERERLTKRSRRRLIAAGAAVLVAAAVIAGVVIASLGEPPSIALVYDGRDETSIGAVLARGWDRAMDEFEVDGQEVIPVTSIRDDIEALIAAETDLIITGTAAVSDQAFDVLSEHPETPMIAIDFFAPPDSESALVIQFDVNEGSFLVGAAAALTSKTGKVGFIGGWDAQLINEFEAGFVAGAKQADPDIEIRSVYLARPSHFFGGFADPERARAVATRMYEETGIDVIFTAAGFSGFGTLQAADASSTALGKQVWAIGVDGDEWLLYRSEPALQQHILTSMLKRFDTGVYTAIDLFVSGDFAPGEIHLGVAEDAVGYSTSGNFLAVETIAALEALKEQIVAGEIAVPERPEEGRVHHTEYLTEGREALEASAELAAAFLDAAHAPQLDVETAEILEGIPTLMFGFLPVAEWFELGRYFEAEISDLTCSPIGLGATCSHTRSDAATRAYGLDAFDKWTVWIEDGAIVDLELSDQLDEAGGALFRWLLNTYPEEMDANCNDTTPASQCAPFQLSHLDEWAATLDR